MAGPFGVALRASYYHPETVATLPPALSTPHNTPHFKAALKTATLLGRVVIINKPNIIIVNFTVRYYVPTLISLIHSKPVYKRICVLLP